MEVSHAVGTMGATWKDEHKSDGSHGTVIGRILVRAQRAGLTTDKSRPEPLLGP